MSYRVVYGETMPAWEKIFPTMREARAFAKEHRSFGDVIFKIAEVVPGEKPQSMAAVIDAGKPASYRRIYEKMQRGKVSADERTK